MNAAPTTPAPRGRVDKRRAILEAAFWVFARDGYAQASVRDIAAEAVVAKPTVYNHFSNKETLFREAIGHASEQILEAQRAALDVALDFADGDTAAMLEEVGYRLLSCHNDPRSWALRRLMYAEIRGFPLLELIRERVSDRIDAALADRLARLAVAGRLRVEDPAEAAEQFTSLLTGSIETRSRVGTRTVPDDELRRVARAATTTFLRAFGSREH